MLSKIVFLCLVLQLARGSIAKQLRDAEEEEEVEYCYNDTTIIGRRPQHEQFTTKTKYELVKGSLVQSSKIPGCEPAKIWLLSRHGTTFPLKSTIDENELIRLRDSIVIPPYQLCEGDIALLQSWELDKEINLHSDELSDEGDREMEHLAKDYKAAFEELFDAPQNVKFRHTTELRNSESFNVFKKSLVDGDESDVVADTSHNETLLFKFYEQCGIWKEKNDKLNESESTLSKFEKSALFNKTIEEISERIGLPDIEWEQIKLMWNMCRIDKALALVDSLSPWCAAFNESHVDVLEYRDDIELYYKTGQGDEINSKLPCEIVADLIKHLEDNSTDSQETVVSFADATTVQLLLTALELHEDSKEPSIDSIKEDRKWKSSETSPFASNVAVVKYDCSSTDQKDKVKIFLNQNLLIPDWCTGDVCEFDKFLVRYQTYKDADCKEYFCPSDKSGTSIAVNGVGVFAVVASLILVYLR